MLFIDFINKQDMKLFSLNIRLQSFFTKLWHRFVIKIICDNQH
jgi:hypothetical protein